MKDNIKSIALIGTVIAGTLFLMTAVAIGQNTEELRRIEEQKIKALYETELKVLKGENRLIFDWGGWINYRYDDYDDDDNDATTDDTLDYTNSLDSRLWLKATLKPPADALYPNEHSLYIRLKNLYIQRLPEDINDSYDNDGPHLDYAYVVLDLRPYWLEAGRRYFSVGQGIAYSNVNDGIELQLALTNWTLKTLLSKTLPHEDNIDLSIPGWDKKSDRTYYGIETTYLGIPGQGIYGYFLVQRDRSDEDPMDEPNDYTYHSEYTGLGVQGKITANTHYWIETIRETGESYVYTTNDKESIDAWAADFGISYDWNVYSNPNFTFEYAFGSGDSSRVSVTDTLDGNIEGNDTNFLYFGYLPTGYALSPNLSNLHLYKIGALLKPLEKYTFFKNLSLGVDYYWYYKDKKEGGISDIDATVNDDNIGREIDLTLSWQILSDLSCSLEYGHFKPGKAYHDSINDNEDYFALSVTLTI